MNMFGLSRADTQRVLILTGVLGPFALLFGIGTAMWSDSLLVAPLRPQDYGAQSSTPSQSKSPVQLLPQLQLRSQSRPRLVTSMQSKSSHPVVTTTDSGKSTSTTETTPSAVLSTSPTNLLKTTTPPTRSAVPSTSMSTSPQPSPPPSTQATQPTMGLPIQP